MGNRLDTSRNKGDQNLFAKERAKLNLQDREVSRDIFTDIDNKQNLDRLFESSGIPEHLKNLFKENPTLGLVLLVTMGLSIPGMLEMGQVQAEQNHIQDSTRIGINSVLIPPVTINTPQIESGKVASPVTEVGREVETDQPINNDQNTQSIIKDANNSLDQLDTQTKQYYLAQNNSFNKFLKNPELSDRIEELPPFNLIEGVQLNDDIVSFYKTFDEYSNHEYPNPLKKSPILNKCTNDEQKNGWKMKYMAKDGEEWYVTVTGLFDLAVINILKKGEETKYNNFIMVRDLYLGGASLDERRENLPKILENLIKSTKEDYENESNPENINKLRNFDLPKGEKIGYLSIFDTNVDNDPATQEGLKSAGNFHNLMNTKGYQLENPIILKTVDPAKDLRAELTKLNKQGIKTVYLEINAHGQNLDEKILGKFYRREEYEENDPSGTRFSEPNMDYGQSNPRPEEMILTGEEFVQIIREYPGMKIVINSLACFGGNASVAFRNAKLKNAAVILQTKPHVPNLSFGNISEFSTRDNPMLKENSQGSYFNKYYQIAIQLMGQKKPIKLPNGFIFKKGIRTIGDAIYFAGCMVRQHSPALNPETILPGGAYIAANRPSLRDRNSPSTENLASRRAPLNKPNKG